MLNTVEELTQILQKNALGEYPVSQLQIDDSAQVAFAIKVDSSKAIATWELMKSLLKQTKRYPVLTYGWGSDDFFSRFYYSEEVVDGKLQGTSPESIIAQAPTADLDAFLEERKTDGAELLLEDDWINYSLEETRERFGSSPTHSQIRGLIENNTIQSIHDLEQWLFSWELQHFNSEDAIATPYTDYLDWFETGEQESVLLLLPTENGWDSLAHLHWFGACSAGTAVAISFLQRWHQQYSAEVVSHYGTMLQLNVKQRPTSPEAAFELAWEQYALAPCTLILPGVSLRDHARTLLAVDQWFLHERP